MTDDNGPEGTRHAKARFGAIAKMLKEGARHPTLGARANGADEDWWKAGEKNFRKMVRLFGLTEKDRVVDYGCGSLRVGAHVIRFLEPGHYFGLEVTPDLIEIGQELIGPELLAAKKPFLAAIDETSVAAASDFGASFVFSHAVAKNVVRSELPFYLAALRRIAHAPGCILYFSAKLADKEFEYLPGGWARPLAAYTEPLRPLELVRIHNASGEPGGPAIQSCKLEFRSPGSRQSP